MNAAFDSVIPIAVVAGNKHQGTVNVAPCKYTESSVCVASSDIEYKFSMFSNYGREVKIIAPSSDISSASIDGDKHYTWKFGISMASPCVAGAMAIYVSFEVINSDVNKGYDHPVTNQIVGIISNVTGGKDGMDSGSPRYGGESTGEKQSMIWKIEIVDKGTRTRKRSE
ncbi:hypothetical protein IL306_004606 [Fusarium sp. DS 682]|nr:hypothetical protein IL306_004606 [Fusarium sp. DS 682]